MKNNILNTSNYYTKKIAENYNKCYSQKLQNTTIEQINNIMELIFRERTCNFVSQSDKVSISACEYKEAYDNVIDFKDCAKLLSNNLEISLEEIFNTQLFDGTNIHNSESCNEDNISDYTLYMFSLQIDNFHFFSQNNWIQMSNFAWLLDSYFNFKTGVMNIVFYSKIVNNEMPMINNMNLSNTTQNKKKFIVKEKSISLFDYLQKCEKEHDSNNNNVLPIFKRTFKSKEFTQELLTPIKSLFNESDCDKIMKIMREFYNINNLSPSTTSRVVIEKSYFNDETTLLFDIVENINKNYQNGIDVNTEKYLTQNVDEILKTTNNTTKNIVLLTTKIILKYYGILSLYNFLSTYLHNTYIYIDFNNLPKIINISFLKYIYNNYNTNVHNIHFYSNKLSKINKKIFTTRLVIINTLQKVTLNTDYIYNNSNSSKKNKQQDGDNFHRKNKKFKY